MNKMAQGDADSRPIFYYFERSSEQLALLDKYHISPNESIGLDTKKVNLYFENIVHC